MQLTTSDHHPTARFHSQFDLAFVLPEVHKLLDQGGNRNQGDNEIHDAQAGGNVPSPESGVLSHVS